MRAREVVSDALIALALFLVCFGLYNLFGAAVTSVVFGLVLVPVALAVAPGKTPRDR